MIDKSTSKSKGKFSPHGEPTRSGLMMIIMRCDDDDVEEMSLRYYGLKKSLTKCVVRLLWSRRSLFLSRVSFSRMMSSLHNPKAKNHPRLMRIAKYLATVVESISRS